MRMVDQSLELTSDKYEKTVEELQDENNELKESLKEKDQIIQKLERQLEEAQKKS